MLKGIKVEQQINCMCNCSFSFSLSSLHEMVCAVLQDLDLVTAVQETQIRELQRSVDDLERANMGLIKRLFGGKPNTEGPS